MRDDRHDGCARSLCGSHETTARAQNDPISLVEGSIGFDIPAGIDEDLTAGLEHLRGVLGRGAETAELAQRQAQGPDGPHRRIVRECVERCVWSEGIPERRHRAHEIGPRDPAVVIRDQHGGPFRQMLEPLHAQSQVVPIDRVHQR